MYARPCQRNVPHDMAHPEKLDRDRNRIDSERIRLPHKRDLAWGDGSQVAHDAVSDTATAVIFDPHDYDGFDTPLRYAAPPERTVESLEAEYAEWYWNQHPPVYHRLPSPDLEKAYRSVKFYVGLPLAAVGLGALTWGMWTLWKQRRK